MRLPEGLTWETILSSREGYRRAIAGFDPAVVARLTLWMKAKCMKYVGIIRDQLMRKSMHRDRSSSNFLPCSETYSSRKAQRTHLTSALYPLARQEDNRSGRLIVWTWPER